MTGQTDTLRWIDCSARIGRWSNPQPEQFTAISGLKAAWDRAGIEGGVVHHSWAWEWSPQRGNARLLEEIDGEGRVRPCLVALPAATREMEPVLEFARRVRSLRGAVRIFPGKHAWSLSDWCAGALFDALALERVPLLVDIGETNWEGIASVLDAHPRLPLLVLNTFYRVDRVVYPLMERHENLHIEANTYGAFFGIEGICERFGANRLVFGTNLPEFETGGPMALVAYAEIGEEDKRKIASGNLMRLLGEEA